MIFGDRTGKQREEFSNIANSERVNHSLIDINKKVVQKCKARVISAELIDNQGSNPFYIIHLIEEDVTIKAVLSGTANRWTGKAMPKSGDFVYVEIKGDMFYPEIIDVIDKMYDQELSMKDSPYNTKYNNEESVNGILLNFLTSWLGNGAKIPSKTKIGEKANIEQISNTNISTELTNTFLYSPVLRTGKSSKVN